MPTATAASSKVGSLATGRLPAQVIAADLNGDGLTDLVVRNAGDGTLSVFFGTDSIGPVVGPIDPVRSPEFLPAVTIPVGLGVSDVQAVDTTGSGRLDLVVTNKLTGQVSILRNLGDGTFGPPEPYRAGTGLSAIDTSGSPEVTSLEATAGVAAGPLTPGGPTDLVTINPGSNTLGVLAGLGGGRFANPVAIQTQHPAQVVRMADFNHDGIPDLALLGTSQVTILLGNGQGGFQPPVSYDAGPEPTGLTVADVNGDGSARSPDRQRLRRPAHPPGQRRRHLPALPQGRPGGGAGRGRPHRRRQARLHLRQPGARSRGRPVRQRPDQGARRPVLRACSPPAPSSWPT